MAKQTDFPALSLGSASAARSDVMASNERSQPELGLVWQHVLLALIGNSVLTEERTEMLCFILLFCVKWNSDDGYESKQISELFEVCID